MFDPIKLAKNTEKIVRHDNLRKYYRFRGAKFYGGIATADCVGCNLRCVFCWAYNVVSTPQKYGKFYSPQEVANKLIKICDKNGYGQVRISGNEPTIAKDHLISVLDFLEGKGINFILETNGILINKKFANELSTYDFLHVRVSLKGTTNEEFSRLTGAKPEFFNHQINALKNLKNAGVSCHPAIMISFSKLENIKKIYKKLENLGFSFIEQEEVIFYPGVKKRLKERGLI